jgi:hypothetical protein
VTWATTWRVVVGILIGLGLGCVPFLQYGLAGHHHAAVAHPHHSHH